MKGRSHWSRVIRCSHVIMKALHNMLLVTKNMGLALIRFSIIPERKIYPNGEIPVIINSCRERGMRAGD